MKKKSTAKKSKKVVMVSGGFDPVHIGHVRMFNEAKLLGDELVIVLNNDNWLKLKKGYVFMPENERKEILEAFKAVDRVILSNHEENTKDISISKEIRALRPHIFAKGGDRHVGNLPSPEIMVCNEIGCEIINDIGHGGKVQSSSELVKKLEKRRKIKSKKYMKPLDQISKEELKNIKMIVFDVDGVLVPRGTKIKQIGNTTTLETKVIAEKQIEQIKELNKRGFLINISSGRGLYMLQEMFRGILPFVSLTYENGSATWYKGQIYQHVNSFEHLKDVFPELVKTASKNVNVKGFEPKEFIITIHCKEQIKEIEEVVKKYPKLTTIWNGEAYDVQIKIDQTKAVGLRHVMEIFKLNKENIMAIGDNYNDAELLNESGMPISADKSRVEGKFYVPLVGDFLPADTLMQKILSL